MYDHVMRNEITECQIFLTRRCNTSCGACNLPMSGRGLKELDLDGWKKVFLNLEKLGIKTVKLMGGEPTEIVMKDLIELIRFVKNNTNIKLALLSNSKWDKSQWLERLCSAGLYGYYASVDTVTEGAICQDSLEKSQKGYEMLLRLKENGQIPLLAANVVMSRKNLNEIPALVELLSEQGFYINLCSLQTFTNPATYNGNVVEYNFRKSWNQFMFTKTDMLGLGRIIVKLLGLQRNGAKIAVPKDYLMMMSVYGARGGTWQCQTFSQLRVDSDGAVMLCNEFRFRGEELPNLSKPIADFSEWKKALIGHWYHERRKYNCQCYWSCFLQAENNIHIGSTEFGFVDNPKLHGIGSEKS
ncbi:MAG: radical SAM protein [Actinobacteria bacterium]|nr:radical SAM protein [Actinomycetota bacterium]